MDRKGIAVMALGLVTLALFAGFSNMVKDTETIWLQTRLFGLLSYAALFTTVVLGELRVLSIKKADFPLFKYHKPIAIFSIYLVVVHFMSAFADSYKWGKLLKWTDYLGFSFQDKWLTLLSFGVLAFYLMVIVAATSATRSIQWFGYRRWKVVHYLSYAAFFIAYYHSVNLGTDVKTSAISPIVAPIMRYSFIFALSFLLARGLKGLGLFTEQFEVTLSTVFFIALILAATSLASHYLQGLDNVGALESNLNVTRDEIILLEEDSQRLSADVQGLVAGIREVKNGQDS